MAGEEEEVIGVFARVVETGSAQSNLLQPVLFASMYKTN